MANLHQYEHVCVVWYEQPHCQQLINKIGHLSSLRGTDRQNGDCRIQMIQDDSKPMCVAQGCQWIMVDRHWEETGDVWGMVARSNIMSLHSRQEECHPK